MPSLSKMNSVARNSSPRSRPNRHVEAEKGGRFMFRVKVMTAGEWADFEINVANIVLGAGDHRHALFREAGNLADPGRILIASPDPGIVEALSPGGWSDCADARERTWMFLVDRKSTRLNSSH